MDAYIKALEFHKDKQIPFGSWRRWLAECYYQIEQRCKFHCSWTILLGMTVAMLEAKPETRREFRQIAQSDYQRSQNRRFLAYFICLTDCLSGASPDAIEKNYRGDGFRKFRTFVPFSIYEWPLTGSANILKNIRLLNVSLPLNSMTDHDLYVTLVYGHYCCSREKSVLELLKLARPIPGQYCISEYIETICNDNALIRDVLFPQAEDGD